MRKSDPERFRREVGEPRFRDHLRLHSSVVVRRELAEVLSEQR